VLVSLEDIDRIITMWQPSKKQQLLTKLEGPDPVHFYVKGVTMVWQRCEGGFMQKVEGRGRAWGSKKG
jgi:hypothetical protein